MEEDGSIKVKFKASLNEQLLVFQIFLRCFIITVDSSPSAFLGVICEFESTAMKHKVSGWKTEEEKIVTPSFSPLGKYIFAVGFTARKVSHENFVQGNAPCLSLKEKKKTHVIAPSGID